MKSAYRLLASLIALGVFVQAAAIAFAWFTVLHDLDGGAVINGDYEGNAGHALHGVVGSMVIPALALILLIVSFFAKVPGGVKWAAIIFGLVVLQVTLAFVAFGAPAVGALHGLNALAILGTSIETARRVRPPSRASAGASVSAASA